MWWSKRRNQPFPSEWQVVRVRKPRFVFAWGPTGGEPRRIGFLEIAIAAGDGGAGTVWIDDLRLEPREPPGRQPTRPEASASSAAAGTSPSDVLAFDPARAWRNLPADVQPWLLLDFERMREYGGVVIDWDPEDFGTAYRLATSDDGDRWETVYEAQAAGGGRDWIYLPDHESRKVRLEMLASSRGQGFGVQYFGVVPAELAVSPNRFLAAVARDEPRGHFPRYLLGEATPWAVVGADGDDAEGLLGADGALEVGREAFSIEPFLLLDGRLVSWASVRATPTLAEGDLPIPSVTWDADGVVLEVTAFASGPPGAASLVARYRLGNTGRTPRAVKLFLAVRPFQVSPPWQNLGMEGGVARIHRLEWDGVALTVDRARRVHPLVAPEAFGASRSEEGPTPRFFAEGRVPPRPVGVADPVGLVGGAFAWQLLLDPGHHEEVSLVIPQHPDLPPPPAPGSRRDATRWTAARLDEAREHWRRRLDGFAIDLPPSASALEESVRASVGWILVNRDPPRIQPGSRAYERSWIRDGAMTAASLLELGFDEEAREFLRWYATHQRADGRIPCCVDQRGADWTPENDSEGEFVWGVVETWRHTQDLAFLAELWPAVRRAAEAIDALRQQRRAPEWRAREGGIFYGLVPHSISHEGYSSRPVHSYWDDLWAVRGLADAAVAATLVGDPEAAQRFSQARDELRADLVASMRTVIEARGLDTLPASAELADFDPNSTAIALDPVGEADALPPAELARTFERWWEEFESRQQGGTDLEAYTAYEMRNAVAYQLLGRPDRALALLEGLVADQRPPAWRQWPEISWRDPALPRFLGDLPHGWIASTYLRSVRRLLVLERHRDGALEIGAGIPERWVDEAPGVRARGLSTHYGVVDLAVRGDGPDRVEVELGGALAVPPAGIEVVSPRARPLRAVTVNGRASDAFDARRALVRELPARIVLHY
ncbi:MAG TPA: discoidin domain-containing protein [Myxococcota bacterium]|nr:discoidin domain-containing protein [Myxococcota bacterium]